MIRKKPLTEKQIQGMILKYLSSRKDVFFWRQNSGSFSKKAKKALSDILNLLPIESHIKARINGSFYKAIGNSECVSEKGLPDIICIFKGMFVGLEVKKQNGRQRQTQLAAEHKINNAGGYYFLVRSVEDVKRALEEVESNC